MNNAVLIQIKEATKNKPRRLVATLIDDNRILNDKKLTQELEVKGQFASILPLVAEVTKRLLFYKGFNHLTPHIGALPNGDWCAVLLDETNY